MEITGSSENLFNFYSPHNHSPGHDTSSNEVSLEETKKHEKLNNAYQ
jgi:hypothetical protein